MSGDVTIDELGITTIGSGKITNSMVANGTIDLTSKVTGILPLANLPTDFSSKIGTATSTEKGLISSSDWNTFNSKQSAISVTTTGTSGAATFTSNTLNIPNYTTYIDNAVSAKAALASPTFTGTVAAPTATVGDSTTMVATTEFVATGLASKVNKAYVDNLLTAKANLASPTFTGTVAAPTPTAGDNTTKVATTAFVKSEILSNTSVKRNVGYVESTTATTLTANQVLTGLFYYSPSASSLVTNNRTLYWPTAANIISGIPNAAVGDFIVMTIFNYNGSNSLTMSPAADGLSGISGTNASRTISNGSSRTFYLRITNIGSSSAITIF
jgi:hypothetical protein